KKMSSSDRDPKPDVFSSLVAEGGWLHQKGQNRKALDSFTKALALNPDDKNCYVGRSGCYLKMVQYVKAFQEAEASLTVDPTFHEGIHMKAEALYYMAEFEFALVFYRRGQKLHPLSHEFRLGIHKAQEAIENSIGSPSSGQLKNEGDLSFFREDEKVTPPFSAIQDLTKEEKQQTPKTPKKEKVKKQILGELYDDRKFLESLMKDEDLMKLQMKDGEQLGDSIQSCISRLDICVDFWLQENPSCVQEKNQKVPQQKPSKPRHSAPSEHAQFLMKSLSDIDAGKTDFCLKKAEDVMKIVQRCSEKEVPDKKQIMGSLHSCMGKAWFDLGDMDKALEHHQRDLEVAEQEIFLTNSKLPEPMSRALENMSRVYTETGQFELAVDCWQKKVPLVRGALEKTWLFHELGCCHVMLDRLEEARDFGLQSAAAAAEAADENWQIHANVLVGLSESKLGNFESGISYFERALTHAQRQKDDAAINAVQKVPLCRHEPHFAAFLAPFKDIYKC
uniref:Outer dynein arm-docking complex subunit 4 n=1 Tax=Stegastes partitus TaxID=144197 RepID=A0A3B4ZKA2_9TELE